MRSEDIGLGCPDSQHDGSIASAGQPRMSRRAVLGGLSTGAAVGTTAWMIPQILTAKPAAGATLSGSPATSPVTLAGTTGTPAFTPTAASGAGAPSTLSSLATTGLDLDRDAEIGATMIAVGWVLHRWASRVPPAATRAAAEGKAGRPGRPA